MPERAALYADFRSAISPHWLTITTGRGSLRLTGTSLRLTNTDTSAHDYTNAQLDDYRHRPRRAFPWHPPLTLTVRARFSHPGPPLTGRGEILGGTAGFGFWNDPFLMSGLRVPTLPRAIWFFYASPPSDMKLDLQTPGYGWKAATIDALRLPALVLATIAPAVVPLMNVPALYRRWWPRAQRVLHISEAPVDVLMTGWHTYVIEWGTRAARFSVDGDQVLASTIPPPPGPLGLVIWLDNQYLVATPWGRFRYGWLTTPGEQWLEIESVSVAPEG